MVAIYSKIVITMLISLFTLPLVLNALGASDYGLFTLIIGVITLLTFLNGSMTVSTQRYFSISMGANDKVKINKIFNISIILHLFVGVIIIVLLEILSFFLFDGFLNIDQNRVSAAKIVYQCLIISTLFTVLSVPFDALINANEDFAVLSIIEIFQSILVLILSISLPFIIHDKLVYYGFGMALIAIIVMLIKGVVCMKNYKECYFNKNSFDKILFNEMFSFAGWNTFGAIAMMGRNQGIAVILNMFSGTIVNAAYGIANQINNVLSNFSITLQKSINPQLMKSEGGNDRNRMLFIAFVSSKFSVYILAFFAIPLIIEMPYVLKVWIKDVPENTILFSQLILILSVVYQFSVGIMSAIQSGGRIKYYQLTIGALLFLNIPISYFLLLNNYPVYSVLICLIIVEVFSLFARIMFSKKLVNLDINRFIKEIIIPCLFILIISFSFSFLPHTFMSESFLRLLLTVLISIISMIFLIWNYGLQIKEKESILSIISKLNRKE